MNKIMPALLVLMLVILTVVPGATAGVPAMASAGSITFGPAAPAIASAGSLTFGTIAPCYISKPCVTPTPTPVVTTPAVTTPAVTTPVVTTPAVTTPAVTPTPEATPVSVPEFPSPVLPVAAVMGLMLLLFYRKRDE